MMGGLVNLEYDHGLSLAGALGLFIMGLLMLAAWEGLEHLAAIRAALVPDEKTDKKTADKPAPTGLAPATGPLAAKIAAERDKAGTQL